MLSLPTVEQSSIRWPGVSCVQQTSEMLELLYVQIVDSDLLLGV
jgi:hypothetical protein